MFGVQKTDFVIINILFLKTIVNRSLFIIHTLCFREIILIHLFFSFERNVAQLLHFWKVFESTLILSSHESNARVWDQASF